MKKLKLRLGMWGLIFVSLIALAVICGLALVDPASMAAMPVLFLVGIGVIALAQRGVLLGMRGAIGMTAGTEKSLKCTAAIATAFTIGKHGADDDHASLATAATDNLAGIFQHTTSAADDFVKLMLSGISSVVYGGTVTRGDPLTSDGTGRAIKATNGQNIIGYATISGVVNDIGYCQLGRQILAQNIATTGTGFTNTAVAEFDPSATAALRTIAAHGLGVYLPDNAIVIRSWYEVITTFTSATDAATIALGVPTDAAAGIKAAVAISNGANPWDAGNVEGIQTGTAASFMTKLTAERELTATVAVEALTAGKLRLYVEYVVSI